MDAEGIYQLEAMSALAGSALRPNAPPQVCACEEHVHGHLNRIEELIREIDPQRPPWHYYLTGAASGLAIGWLFGRKR